ncbi:hypothetical protein FJZ40_03860 [Candidatus Shapirobacteria bacterium]|nr:hypothetical protein [Candidatus Shapirobacteria bacterium]
MTEARKAIGFLKHKQDWILAFLILVLFSFFRFYQLDKRLIFDWDQERDAFVVKEILREGKMTLVGPRVLGPKGFFLGPYFSYLLVPFYFLTNLHPKALVFFIATYNLAFFAFSFSVLKKFVSSQIALLFLLFWALNAALVNIDQIAWNVLFIPLVVVLNWGLLFYKKDGSWLKWLTIGVLVGAGINFHFQLVFLVIFNFLFILLFSRKGVWKRFLLFLMGMVLTFLPLMIFDLRHKFLNLKLLFSFLSERLGTNDYLAWWPVWENVSRGFTNDKIISAPFLLYFSVLVMGSWWWKREKKSSFKHFLFAFLALWIIFPFGFSVFGQRPSEYYFIFLFPFIILILAYWAQAAIKKIAISFSPCLIFLIVILLLLNFKTLQKGLGFNLLGLFYKDKVAQRVAEIGFRTKINVSFSVPLGLDTGYRYLLDLYQVKQSNNPHDILLQVVIPPTKSDQVFGGIGLRVPNSIE